MMALILVSADASRIIRKKMLPLPYLGPLRGPSPQRGGAC